MWRWTPSTWARIAIELQASLQAECFSQPCPLQLLPSSLCLPKQQWWWIWGDLGVRRSLQYCCVTLKLYHHCSDTCLRESAHPHSHLWFVTSLKNIQKLPAKSLQLRETNSGKRGRCAYNSCAGNSRQEAGQQRHIVQNNKKLCYKRNKNATVMQITSEVSCAITWDQ